MKRAILLGSWVAGVVCVWSLLKAAARGDEPTPLTVAEIIRR